MTTGADHLLADAFGRVQEAVHDAVEGLTAAQLTARLDPDANSIAWLIWHLTRVQDDHIAAAADVEQVWTAKGWMKRFDLPLDPKAIGYGHTSSEVAAVQVDSPETLLGYHDAVHRMTVDYVRGLQEADYDRIVDRSFNPAVTLGVRLISIVGDALMHAGQAQYVRGVLERKGVR